MISTRLQCWTPHDKMSSNGASFQKIASNCMMIAGRSVQPGRARCRNPAPNWRRATLLSRAYKVGRAWRPRCRANLAAGFSGLFGSGSRTCLSARGPNSTDRNESRVTCSHRIFVSRGTLPARLPAATARRRKAAPSCFQSRPPSFLKCAMTAPPDFRKCIAAARPTTGILSRFAVIASRNHLANDGEDERRRHGELENTRLTGKRDATVCADYNNENRPTNNVTLTTCH